MDTITGSLDPAQVRALDTAVARVDYFSLHDSYQGDDGGCPEYWTDSPSVITSVMVGGRAKQIHHDHGCLEKNTREIHPRALTRFEDAVDSIVGTGRWVGTDGEWQVW